jgi:predicted DNA-binding transcriptional regulator AlpA
MDTRPPSYLSCASLARELDVSERTVQEMVRRGVLPQPLKLSAGCVRWCWSDVQLALGSLAVGGGGEIDPFLKGVRDATSPQQ